MDKNGRASGIEIECLKPHVGTGTTFESTPSHLKDIEIFNIQNIISKPLTVLPMTKGKWNIPDYPMLKEKFEMFTKLNLDDVYAEFCNK